MSAWEQKVVTAEDIDFLGVLSFCPWPQRAAATALSPAWRAALGLTARDASTQANDPLRAGAGYWRFLCDRLAEERRVYVPRAIGGDANAAVPPLGAASSWRALFEELYNLSAYVPEGATDADDEQKHVGLEVFKIDVAARFRPTQGCGLSTAGDEAVIPIHQRVQLLRQQTGCSQKEALRTIMRHCAKGPMRNWQKGTGLGHNDFLFESLSCADATEDKENICLSKDTKDDEETKALDNEIAEEPSKRAGESISYSMTAATSRIMAVREGSSSVLALTRTTGLKEFNFGRVFADASHQDHIYETSARRLVMEFLNGRSASIICYGQTSSGKTYTMFGPNASYASDGKASGEEHRGIVPRACDEILGAVRLWRDRGQQVELGVSYVEVFGSEVSDLLREGQVVGQDRQGRYGAVRATDRVGHRYVLDGNTECRVNSWEEVEELLRLGDIAKRRASTQMNDRSTRAHTILVMSLTTHGHMSNERGVQSEQVQSNRFYFADLGGSEKLSKSGADAGTKAPVIMVGGEEQSRISWAEYYHARRRIQETQNINIGLFALKNVIDKLHQRSRLSRDGTPAHQLPYVPYQDSKLTMLLKEALGGAARTLIVATATMDETHVQESLQTLRFADTCAQVEKQQEAETVDSVQAALGQIDAEVAQLQADVIRKERWETQFVRRKDVDTVGGAFGEGTTYEREEVIPRSVLVGAEVERERLEQLLQRKAELQGLSGVAAAERDYRAMQAKHKGSASDGGVGVDFRQRDRFGGKTKANAFEEESVVVDALRFFFRRAPRAAVVFGETPSSVRRRLKPEEIHKGYAEVAQTLRRLWEEQSEKGIETRSFGKAMLDRCQDWSKELQTTDDRENGLINLLDECGLFSDACELFTSGASPSKSQVHSPDSLTVQLRNGW